VAGVPIEQVHRSEKRRRGEALESTGMLHASRGVVSMQACETCSVRHDARLRSKVSRDLRLARRGQPIGSLTRQTGGRLRARAVQAEREPSSQMARNIRLPASTLEDRGHA